MLKTDEDNEMVALYYNTPDNQPPKPHEPIDWAEIMTQEKLDTLPPELKAVQDQLFSHLGKEELVELATLLENNIDLKQSEAYDKIFNINLYDVGVEWAYNFPQEMEMRIQEYMMKHNKPVLNIEELELETEPEASPDYPEVKPE